MESRAVGTRSRRPGPTRMCGCSCPADGRARRGTGRRRLMAPGGASILAGLGSSSRGPAFAPGQSPTISHARTGDNAMPGDRRGGSRRGLPTGNGRRARIGRPTPTVPGDLSQGHAASPASPADLLSSVCTIHGALFIPVAARPSRPARRRKAAGRRGPFATPCENRAQGTNSCLKPRTSSSTGQPITWS